MSLPKIIMPTFEFKIPSNGKQVKMRPMLVREEKILLIAKQSGLQSDIMAAIKQIVSNCVLTEGLNVDNIAIFDLEYLFIKLRSISISNVTKVSYKDNEDEKVYDFDIDLDKIEIDMSKVAPNKISLSSDIVMEMNWPMASTYSKADIYEANEADTFTMMIANCMGKIHQGDTAVDPKSSTKEELAEFIDNIPAKSAIEIRKFFESMPTLKHEIKYKNSKGSERTITLDSLDDFFTL
jgi:hypothetical protein